MQRIHAFTLASLFILGCSDDSSKGGTEACTVDTSYDPVINPVSFKSVVENPLFPLVVGTKRTYVAGVTGTETVEVTVLPDKKDLLGVQCTTVHDFHGVAGEPIEDTLDWYAEDLDGNVWYMGEDTKEYKAGQVVSTEGSWQAGVDGAKPGILIPAVPTIRQPYHQEYYACQAEDMGEVLDTNATVSLGDGGVTYTGCLKTHDYTPLEPDVNEEKYYCPDPTTGGGNVLSVDMVTGEREELIKIETVP